MTKNGKILYFLISVIFFIFADIFLTQNILIQNTSVNNPIFSIVFVENTGAAFNIFQGYKIFLITFSAIAILAILAFSVKNIKDFKCYYLFLNAMLAAGIFCNMAERIEYGFVRDYIKLNFIDFPVFNISDIFINISVFTIVILIIKNSYRKNENNHR